MSTPQAYSYLDAGAPQIIFNDPQTFLNVLKSVLVSGYGTKSSAGWSLFAEDQIAHKLVLKQGPGGISSPPAKYFRLGNLQSGFIGIQPSWLSYGPGWYFDARGYESMTTIDTGLAPFPQQNQISTGNYNWTYGCVPNSVSTLSAIYTYTATVPWCIVADDRIFYLILYPGMTTPDPLGNNYPTPIIFVFGDIKQEISSDQYATVISAVDYNENTGSTGTPANVFQQINSSGTFLNYGNKFLNISTNSGAAGTTYFYFCRSINGQVTPINASIGYRTSECDLNGGFFSSLNGVTGGNLGVQPYANTIYFDQPYVHEQGTLRGRLPGVLASSLPTATLLNMFSSGLTSFTNNGIPMFYCRLGPNQGTYLHLFFRLDAWRT